MASKEIPTTQVNASRLSCVLTLGAAVWLYVSMVSFVTPGRLSSAPAEPRVLARDSGPRAAEIATRLSGTLG